MSSFRVRPNELLAQSKQLDAVCRELSQDVGEIGGVIRQLGAMSGFEDQIAVLSWAQRRGSEQQVKLRQCARTLVKVAELYTSTERKNLDGNSAFIVRTLPKTVKYFYGPAWRTQEMLSNPHELFGMEVAVRK